MHGMIMDFLKFEILYWVLNFEPKMHGDAPYNMDGKYT